MEEIKLNMENLTKEEREQLLKLVEKANKKESKVWKPEARDFYYYIEADIYTICNKGISGAFWENSSADKHRYSLGNCFKTVEEAEFALEKLRVITELERFAKEHNDVTKEATWELGYNRKQKAVDSIEYIDNFVFNIRFTSCNLVDEAIKTIGEDRLKKYYFGIEE